MRHLYVVDSRMKLNRRLLVVERWGVLIAGLNARHLWLVGGGRWLMDDGGMKLNQSHTIVSCGVGCQQVTSSYFKIFTAYLQIILLG